MKFSFLHVADLHLGYYQYNSKERFNDFAGAALWAAQEAVDRAVNFVVVAGDLFHKRSNLQPTTLGQAERFLELLREAHIPCVLIEGNHDRPLYRDTGITWCQYLAQHEWMTLLNYVPDSSGTLVAADHHTVGSFVEIMDQVFVFGVGYKGAGLRATLEALAPSLHKVSRQGAYSVLMLHAGMQGQLPNHVPDTLRRTDLDPFRPAVDYVALGHFHKPFQLDNLDHWIFNPGSLEVTAWDQYNPTQPGGVKLVQVDTCQSPMHQVAHLASPVRPRIKERFDVSRVDNPKALGEQFESHLQHRRNHVHAATSGTRRPILRILLTGALRFEAFQLNLEDLKARAERIFTPLVCEITLVDRPGFSHGNLEAAPESLQEVEYRILREMIAQNPAYATDPERCLAIVQDTADLVLAKVNPQKIYETLNAMDDLGSTDREKSF